ncbi:MAG: hypothetical protein IJW17_08255 [Lentisphaeria bacterium]|nr:hypothetical protein [Lentisphaeria bacterium]
MNKEQTEKFIELACSQLKMQIENSNLQNIAEYYEILKDIPDKIEKQAKGSSNLLQKADALSILSAIVFQKAYLDQISALMTAFRRCNLIQKVNITHAHLTPTEIDQIARQLTVAPGIFAAYRNIMGDNS